MKTIKIYYKLYLSKYSIIALIVTFFIMLSAIIYQIYTNYNSYFIYHNKIENNYMDLVLNILNISLIFIVLSLILRESNLLANSFDTMMESMLGRKKIFIYKQITIISLIIIISLIFYILAFCPIYFIYKLFKFDFLKSYIYLLIYLIEISQLALFINYIFKNHFISLMLGIIIIVKESIKIEYLNYILPTTIFDNGIYFNVNIYYIISYILILFFINYRLYTKMDRK